MSKLSFESEAASRFLSTSQPEALLNDIISDISEPIDFAVVQGFEDRSLSALQRIGEARRPIDTLYIARYPDANSANARLSEALHELVKSSAPRTLQHVRLLKDGGWVSALRHRGTSRPLFFDITGLSTRHLFGALDQVSRQIRPVYLIYTEAETYWPTFDAWRELTATHQDSEKLAQKVDEMPWLFGCVHNVEAIPGHDGFDSLVSGRALIAFLPFKGARLGAILGEQDYREILFLSGQPRLRANRWREQALRDINEPLLGQAEPIVLSTFGYRDTVQNLMAVLTDNNSPLLKYNVDLALLGSKLQTVGCWVISQIFPSITCLTATPAQYFPASFSSGAGSSFAFPIPKW